MGPPQRRTTTATGVSNVRGNFGGGRAPKSKRVAKGTMARYAKRKSTPKRQGWISGGISGQKSWKVNTGSGKAQGYSRTTTRSSSTAPRTRNTAQQEYRARQAGGGGGGGGVNSRQTKSLVDQMKKEAAARNKKFEAIMKKQQEMQAKLMKDARGQITKQGKARRQDIQETGVRRQAQGTQSMIGRGLGNTTITDSVRRGINDSTDRSMTQQGDLEAGRMAQTYEREAGMQIPEGQFQLGGVRGMGGGLEDYIKMLQSVGGGLS